MRCPKVLAVSRRSSVSPRASFRRSRHRVNGPRELDQRLKKLAGSLGEPYCVTKIVSAKLHASLPTGSLGEFELKIEGRGKASSKLPIDCN
jgi:hypothetical protein